MEIDASVLAHSFEPLRVEDPPLLKGQASFTSDIDGVDALRVVFFRSSYAGGIIRSLEIQAVQNLEGVFGVFTGADLEGQLMPAPNPLLPLIPLKSGARNRPVLTSDVIQYVGQPLAMIVARNEAVAQEALALIELQLDSDIQPSAANNQTIAQINFGLPFNEHGVERLGGTHSVSYSAVVPRVVAFAMEPRCVVADYRELSGEALLLVSLGTQTPSRARADIAELVGLPLNQVDVNSAFVGGAFGAKASLTPEELLTAWAAVKLRQKVKWQATRSEEFLSGYHGRNAQLQGNLTADSEGKFLSLDAQLDFDVGAWMPFSAVVPLRNAARILPGPYRVQNVHVRGEAHLGRGAAVNIYRGAGRPEAALLMECLVEKLARAVRIDPLELRKNNIVTDLPYLTPSGETLDSGNYLIALEQCAARFDYANRREQQTIRRRHSQTSASIPDSLIGIGTALYLEPCGLGWESARITMHSNGRVSVGSGTPAQGQGHKTLFATIAARELAISPDLIDVTYGDTRVCPEGIGTLASRSTAIGGSAVAQACRQLKQRLQQGESLPITVDLRYNAKEAWGYGCVMVQVSIDRQTGELHIDHLTWVDDAGEQFVPELVQGQLLGGLAQGLGQSIMEEIVYDPQGQLLTATLMDYAIPRAIDMPTVDIHSIKHLSPNNLLGAKGVGEAGCIGVPAAILNAAIDALSQNFEVNLQLPLTSEQLWRAMRSERK